jgi:hypothetical protein
MSNKRLTKKDGIIFIIAICIIIGLASGFAIGVNVGGNSCIKSCEEAIITMQEAEDLINKESPIMIEIKEAVEWDE